jgi:hypothetical protein
MSHARRACRRLGNATAAASVLVAAAVLAPAHARSTPIVSVKLSSASAGAQSASAASGAVGGVRSPVDEGETMNLKINASDTGAGLVSAHVSIGGSSASVSLCPAPVSVGGQLIDGCPESVSEVPLSIDVGRAGSHSLAVTVTDAAGHLSTLVEQTIEVLAPPKQEGNTLTIGVSNGHVGPHGELLSEEPAGHESLGFKEAQPPPVCPSPMLAMRLAVRPLGHTRRHVPVLWAGRRYRFTGRLTCLHGRRRISAPDGTTVLALDQRHRCVRGHPKCKVRWRERTVTVHKGALKIRLRVSSRGTVIFRYRPSHGESVRVRLRVAVRHMRHRGGCPRPRQRDVGGCRRRAGRSL